MDVEATLSKDTGVRQALSHCTWCCWRTLDTRARWLFYLRHVWTAPKTPSASRASHETAPSISETHWTLITIRSHRHGLIQTVNGGDAVELLAVLSATFRCSSCSVICRNRFLSLRCSAMFTCFRDTFPINGIAT